MTEFLKVLMRKNSLRKQCQDLSIADVEKVIADLNEIHGEKIAVEEEKQRIEQEKNEKIDVIRRTMQEAGLSFDDLRDLVAETPKKKVEAKYRIEDEGGNVHEWSGRGRTPLAFQRYFDKHGVDKDACRIK